MGSKYYTTETVRIDMRIIAELELYRKMAAERHLPDESMYIYLYIYAFFRQSTYFSLSKHIKEVLSFMISNREQ
jgi:hypothetical protein